MELDKLVAEIKGCHSAMAQIDASLTEQVSAAKEAKRDVTAELVKLEGELDAVRKVEIATHELAVARGITDPADVPEVPSRASVFAEMKGA